MSIRKSRPQAGRDRAEGEGKMNETAEEAPRIQINLDANAVAAPAHAAASTCREIVDFCFGAMAKADLSKRPMGVENFFRFDAKGPDLTVDERRAMYESWILAKAFQDLMRGVRASLEQAFLFIELVSSPGHKVKSASTLGDFVAPFVQRGARKKFPNLLSDVNSRLQKPLEFAAAYQSLQNARNCLEHRGGVVGTSDIGADGMMELSFPRMKLFYERHGEEVELEAGSAVDAGDGKPDVMILMRLDVRRRHFRLGERLVLSIDDFNEIAFACFQFGSQLAMTLPKLNDPAR
jgi:hypothetical protein